MQMSVSRRCWLRMGQLPLAGSELQQVNRVSPRGIFFFNFFFQSSRGSPGCFGLGKSTNPPCRDIAHLTHASLSWAPATSAGRGGGGRPAGGQGPAPGCVPARGGPAWAPGSASRAAQHSPSRAARGRAAPAASRSAQAPPFALGSVGPHSL